MSENVKWGMVIDLDKCTGCQACSIACKSENNVPHGSPDEQNRRLESYWHRVIAVTNNDYPAVNTTIIPMPCMHCENPACVQVCPVGALVEKDVRYHVRPWETQKVRTTCSYCGVGCQLHLHVRDNRVVKVSGVEGEVPNLGSLCVKGRFGFHFVGSDQRLTDPLIKENGTFRQATWEEAIDLVAGKLKNIRDTHGGDSIGVLTSARITNEENYIAHKFTRAVLKTNNIDHCARL